MFNLLRRCRGRRSPGCGETSSLPSITSTTWRTCWQSCARFFSAHGLSTTRRGSSIIGTIVPCLPRAFIDVECNGGASFSESAKISARHETSARPRPKISSQSISPPLQLGSGRFPIWNDRVQGAPPIRLGEVQAITHTPTDARRHPRTSKDPPHPGNHILRQRPTGIVDKICHDGSVEPNPRFQPRPTFIPPRLELKFAWVQSVDRRSAAQHSPRRAHGSQRRFSFRVGLADSCKEFHFSLGATLVFCT